MNKTNLFKALLLALVGGTIAFTACSPTNEPRSNDQPTEELHYNVELVFNNHDISQLHVDTIGKYATNTFVDTIFIMPEDSYCLTGLSSKGVIACRNLLESCINVAPQKVWGKGDLRFARDIRVNPADSLWFVEHGWTVNQSRQW